MRLHGCLARPRPHGTGLIRRSFIGNRGVRAFWRLLIFIILVAALAAILNLLLHLTPLAQTFFMQKPLQGATTLPPQGPGPFVFIELSILLPTLIATAIMAHLEASGFTSFGLSGPNRRSRFAIGYLAGLVFISLLVATLILSGHATITATHHGLAADLRYALIWLAVFLLVGFTEEFTFRGYILNTLTSGTGFWPAAILTSLLFGAVHGVNPGETPIGQITAFGSGLLFCIGIRQTGSLWWAIGLHAAWDWSESDLYGSNDSGLRSIGRLATLSPHGNIYLSGGTTGPEGSIFCLILLALACLATAYLLRPSPSSTS